LTEHFRQYAEAVLNRINPLLGGLVIDIGSNDGTLLRFFQKRGMQVLGIDPAGHVAEKATNSGIETLPEYFTVELARKIKSERGCAAIITANNVFANIDELDDMITGIRQLMAPDGVFVFETSYLLDVVQKMLIETFFHEHLSYFSVKPLQDFFKHYGMELIDIERVPTKGGSIRCTVQLVGGPRKISPSVTELISIEENFGLQSSQPFKDFSSRLNARKNELHALLGELKAKGKSIAGYGASVGVTTIIYEFGIAGFLDFIVDDNPSRHGLFSPGYHISVLSSQVIYERKPNYILILAWGYAEPIMRKNQEYLEQGGHFILPLPEVKII
jgi:SAM-dependent methyltransferase